MVNTKGRSEPDGRDKTVNYRIESGSHEIKREI